MKRQSTSVMLLLLYALLIAALLVLVFSGASLYSNVVEARQVNSVRRNALSFIQSQIAGCEDSVLLKPGPEGQMLCLPEQDTGFETRIYLYEGALRTAFSRTDAPVDGEGADTICPMEAFELTWQAENLLQISADGTLAYAACGRGGSHD